MLKLQTPPETRYVSVSPETWSLIRGAYLSGLSARTVAGRFGVSEGALRKRAAREGWTKRAFAARATPWPGAPEPPRPAAFAGSAGTAAPLAAKAGEADAPLTEDDIIAAWTAPIQIRPGDLARRALAGAAQAVKGGHGLTALRLARAASEIARLDALFEWVEFDPAEQEAQSEAGQQMARQFLRERALKLARDLALGRPCRPNTPSSPSLRRVTHEGRLSPEGRISHFCAGRDGGVAAPSRCHLDRSGRSLSQGLSAALLPQLEKG